MALIDIAERRRRRGQQLQADVERGVGTMLGGLALGTENERRGEQMARVRAEDERRALERQRESGRAILEGLLQLEGEEPAPREDDDILAPATPEELDAAIVRRVRARGIPQEALASEEIAGARRVADVSRRAAAERAAAEKAERERKAQLEADRLRLEREDRERKAKLDEERLRQDKAESAARLSLQREQREAMREEREASRQMRQAEQQERADLRAAEKARPTEKDTEALEGLDDLEANVSRLLTLSKDIGTGFAQGRILKVRDFFGALSPQEKEFVSGTLKVINDKIKQQTGAGLSNQEADRIMATMSQLKDDDEAFDSGLRTVIDQLRAARARRFKSMAARGKDVSAFLPPIEERVQQLKAEGVSRAEAERILREEGYSD